MPIEKGMRLMRQPASTRGSATDSPSKPTDALYDLDADPVAVRVPRLLGPELRRSLPLSGVGDPIVLAFALTIGQ